MYFSKAGTFSEQPLFKKKTFLEAGVSWKQSDFLITFSDSCV